MELMKKGNALVLGLAVLLVAGCGGDEPEPGNNDTQVQNQKKCYLVKEDEQGELYEYLYDSANRVRRINRKLSSDGRLLRFDSLDYDNAGNRFRIRQFSISNVLTGYELYEYNADKLLTKVSVYSGNGGAIQLQGGDMYEYNNQKQLIKKAGFSAQQPAGEGGYFAFTYLPNGDVREDKFVMQNNTVVLQHAQTYQFTNIKHRLTQVGFLQGYVGHAFLIKPLVVNSPNTTWVTNADGYPVKETITDSGQNYIATYDYNCQ